MITIANEAHVMTTFKGFRNDPHVVFKITIKGRPKTIENTYYGMCMQERFDNGETLSDAYKKARDTENRYPSFNDNLIAIYNELGEDCFEMIALCRDMPYITAVIIKRGYIASQTECLNIIKMKCSVQSDIEKWNEIRNNDGYVENAKERYHSDRTGAKTRERIRYQDNREIRLANSIEYYQNNKASKISYQKAYYKIKFANMSQEDKDIANAKARAKARIKSANMSQEDKDIRNAKANARKKARRDANKISRKRDNDDVDLC